MSHTPGPWRIADRDDERWGRTIRGGDNSFVAEVEVDDAHLIASTPELLEACREALALLSDPMALDAGTKLRREDEVEAILSAAIAKAEGQS